MGAVLDRVDLIEELAGYGVKSVSKDAPVVTNEKGAKQSATAYRMDLMPPLATLAVAEVLKYGADKYGENNWHGIPVKDHLNHLLIHLFAYLTGDKQDDHLEHMACRAMMALEIARREATKSPQSVFDEDRSADLYLATMYGWSLVQAREIRQYAAINQTTLHHAERVLGYATTR